MNFIVISVKIHRHDAALRGILVKKAKQLSFASPNNKTLHKKGATCKGKNLLVRGDGTGIYKMGLIILLRIICLENVPIPLKQPFCVAG